MGNAVEEPVKDRLSRLRRGPFPAVQISGNLIPALRLFKGYRGIGHFHLFIRPEAPSDSQALIHREGVSIPLQVVLAAFPHPQGNIQTFRCLHKGGQTFLVRVAPIFMKFQDNVVCSLLRRIVVKDGEVRCPVGAFENDHMPGVNVPDRTGQSAVQRQQLRIIPAVPVGDGFIQKVIAADGRLIPVANRQKTPHLHKDILISPVCKQLRDIRFTVVNVLPRLSPRRAVHIQEQIYPVFFTPCQAVVHMPQICRMESDRILLPDIKQMPGVHGKPHGVQPLPRDPCNIPFGDISVIIPFPEGFRVTLPAQFT